MNEYMKLNTNIQNTLDKIPTSTPSSCSRHNAIPLNSRQHKFSIAHRTSRSILTVHCTTNIALGTLQVLLISLAGCLLQCSAHVICLKGDSILLI